MGGCFSTSKSSGSNGNTPSTTAGNNHYHRKGGTKPPSSTTTTSTKTSTKKNQTKENHKNNHQQQTHKNSQQIKQKDSRRQRGVIPCGKRTDFGYDKDFDKRYAIGKLLGHGQFGYTYIATDKSNGDRVAVKKIDKNKYLYGSLWWDLSAEFLLLTCKGIRGQHYYGNLCFPYVI